METLFKFLDKYCEFNIFTEIKVYLVINSKYNLLQTFDLNNYKNDFELLKVELHKICDDNIWNNQNVDVVLTSNIKGFYILYSVDSVVKMDYPNI